MNYVTKKDFNELKGNFNDFVEKDYRPFKDKVIEKLLDHDERLERIEENMATKKDIGRVMNVLDDIMVEVKASREERAAMHARLDRHEDKIEKNTKNISLLKTAIS